MVPAAKKASLRLLVPHWEHWGAAGLGAQGRTCTSHPGRSSRGPGCSARCSHHLQGRGRGTEVKFCSCGYPVLMIYLFKGRRQGAVTEPWPCRARHRPAPSCWCPVPSPPSPLPRHLLTGSCRSPGPGDGCSPLTEPLLTRGKTSQTKPSASSLQPPPPSWQMALGTQRLSGAGGGQANLQEGILPHRIQDEATQVRDLRSAPCPASPRSRGTSPPACSATATPICVVN